METKLLKVMIIDNNQEIHPIYRQQFNVFNDFLLAGIYTSIEDGLYNFPKTMPDILICEDQLPKFNGHDAISLFKQKNEDLQIIFIKKDPSFSLIKEAFKNGANGYLTKPVDAKRMHRALTAIKQEGAAMSMDIVKQVIANFHKKKYEFFSRRENQIIDFLSKGATYKVIAEKLFVTTSTVNFHIQNIYEKLNVKSKSEALLKLQEME